MLQTIVMFLVNIVWQFLLWFFTVSLCQASQVCKVWYQLTEEQSLWRRFCCQPKWRLCKAAEHKQVISHMSHGSIQVCVENYKPYNSLCKFILAWLWNNLKAYSNMLWSISGTNQYWSDLVKVPYSGKQLHTKNSSDRAQTCDLLIPNKIL